MRKDWFPSDKPPKHYNNIIVHQKDGYVGAGYYNGEKFVDLNSYEFDDVVEWTEMPKPPETPGRISIESEIMRWKNMLEANAKRILVEYEDGTVTELSKGIAAECDHENMHVELVNVSKLDMVRIAYGMLMTVDQMDMTPLLQAYVSGENLPDET